MKEKLLFVFLSVLSVVSMLAAGAIYSLTAIFLAERHAPHRLVYVGLALCAAAAGFTVYSLIESAVARSYGMTGRRFAAAALGVPSLLFLLWLALCRIAGLPGHLPAACGSVICCALLLLLCIRYLLRHRRR